MKRLAVALVVLISGFTVATGVAAHGNGKGGNHGSGAATHGKTSVSTTLSTTQTAHGNGSAVVQAAHTCPRGHGKKTTTTTTTTSTTGTTVTTTVTGTTTTSTTYRNHGQCVKAVARHHGKGHHKP